LNIGKIESDEVLEIKLSSPELIDSPLGKDTDLPECPKL